MTASASKPRVKPQRRIIERPRLIKLLDETDARTILLIAPAGYGKTTLARQWAKTLNGAIWLTLTPAHRDVAWLAEDFAVAIDTLAEGKASEIRQHVLARRNPQRAATELGTAVARAATANRVQTIVLDDYQELAPSVQAEEFVRVLCETVRARMLIVSRRRPGWLSERRLVYGDAFEITRGELAMTGEESAQILGRAKVSTTLREQAHGWPAVISLAAAGPPPDVPPGTLPQALHRYLAEELFNRVPPDLQDLLMSMALLSDQTGEELEHRCGPDAKRLSAAAFELGFSSSEFDLELHPLLREFLLSKLLRQPEVNAQARAAVADHLVRESWDHAFALILRFGLFDLVDNALQAAYKPLARAGRLQTLSAFAEAVGAAPTLAPPSVDVVTAELALGDGELALARDLARAAVESLPEKHAIASRGWAIVGQVSFFLADFEAAESAYERSRKAAADEQDEMEAIYGLAMSRVFGEHANAAESVAAIEAFGRRGAAEFLRAQTIRLAFTRLSGSANGLRLPSLTPARRALPRAQDPRARSSLTYTTASLLAFKAEYEKATDWLAMFFDDATKFNLEFAMPYGLWTLGQVALGQRRYRDAEKALHRLDELASKSSDRHHQLNAVLLRARLMLQTGEAAGALELVEPESDIPLLPSWRGEHAATQALALACCGHTKKAEAAAVLAERATLATDVHVLAQTARCIAAGSAKQLHRLFDLARRTDTWDAVVCGLRSSRELADAVVKDPEVRVPLAELCKRTHDSVLARRAGIRIPPTGRSRDVLSPREAEVLGLIARGFKNRDIARALFIAESTTKVHVHHILEKLDVRTRAEAVARFQSMEEPA